MNALHQRILGIIFAATRVRGYIGAWHICDELQVDRMMIGSAIPLSEYDQALHDLIEQGYVEELPDVGNRYRVRW